MLVEIWKRVSLSHHRSLARCFRLRQRDRSGRSLADPDGDGSPPADERDPSDGADRTGRVIPEDAAASRRPRRRELLWLATPLLFVIAPMMTFYAANVDELRPIDLLPYAALAMLGVTVLTALVAALVRKVPTAALWASMLTVAFFYYGHAADLVIGLHLRAGSVTVHEDWVLAPVLVLVVVVLVFASRRQRYVESAVRAIALLGVGFTAGALISVVLAQAGVSQATVKAFPAVDTGWPAARRATGATLPDIYYLVLDAHTSNGSLSEFAGYDNAGFTNALAQKGFYVARDSKSNYSNTFLCLASVLNMDYVNDRAKSIAGDNEEPMYDLISDNRVKRILKENGYSYVLVASGWGPTDRAPDADYFHPSPQSDLGLALLQTTVCRVHLVNGSLVSLWDWWSADSKRSTIRGEFAYLESCGRIKGPKFVFAHIVAPHPPFVFRANGEAVLGPVIWNWDNPAASIPAYVAQLQAIDAMTLHFVGTTLRERQRPTIIVIQGDHGTMFATPGDPNPLTTLYRRRHSILNAMYYSEGPLEQLYPSVSPVNTFRVVLNKAIGARYPLLEDQSYFSYADHPYRFTNVTGLVK